MKTLHGPTVPAFIHPHNVQNGHDLATEIPYSLKAHTSLQESQRLQEYIRTGQKPGIALDEMFEVQPGTDMHVIIVDQQSEKREVSANTIMN